MTEAGSRAAGQSGHAAGTETEGQPTGTGTEEATPAGSAPESPPDRGPVAGFRTGLVVAVVFVLGLALGAVAVGLLSDSAPPPTAERVDPETDGGLIVGDLDPDAGPFQVNAACLGAFNAAQDAYGTMDEFGQAAAALDAAQLDEVVRRLQPLQRQLEAESDACRVTAVDDPAEDLFPATTSAPPPAPSPSSPTG